MVGNNVFQKHYLIILYEFYIKQGLGESINFLSYCTSEGKL